MVSPTIVAVASVAAIVLLIIPMLYLTLLGIRDDHRAATISSVDDDE